MAGYQGWFSVKGDDSGNNGYVHCGRDGKFEPGYAGIEFWPDMTEYTKKYPVDFVYPDNSQAYFSVLPMKRLSICTSNGCNNTESMAFSFRDSYLP